MAIATSLPEITITGMAFLRGLPVIAFGNIMGSNVFNCFLVGVLDLMSHKGRVLLLSSKENIFACIISFCATLCVIIGFSVSRRKARYEQLILTMIVFMGLVGYYFIYRGI